MEFLAIWFFCGVVAGAIASGKNRSFVGFFFLGILFGPLGIIGAIYAGREK